MRWILLVAALLLGTASQAHEGDTITYTPYEEDQKIVFEFYFDHNYLVTDFVRFEDTDGYWHSYYVLTHGDS